MRLNNIIYQKIRFACLLIFCIFLSWPSFAQEQKERKVKQLIDVTLKVTDESGTPIPKASVVVGEGIIHAETDQTGSVSFSGYSVDVVTVTASGFEKSVSFITDLLKTRTVALTIAKIHMTSDDIIQLPYSELKRRHLTGSEIAFSSENLERYPSSDIRNSFTGLASGWDIRELNGSPGFSSQEGLQDISGIGNAMGATNKFAGMPMVMVDGLQTELNEAPVNPEDIESVTLLKGILATAMYGPQGAGGILLINTKHGVKNERILNVDVEAGISTIDRMPGWTDGVEYATLNNMARVNSGLAEKYTPTAIAAYGQNNENDLRYPNVNWKEKTLDNTKSFTRANLSASGGNDAVQYFSSVSYYGEGDIYKIGSTADYNRIDARQNVKVKINNQFDVKLGFYGNMTIRRSPNYGYDPDYTSEDAGTNPVLGIQELPLIFGDTPPPTVLGNLNTTPPVAFPLYAYIDPETSIPWYGVSSSYTQNPVGGLSSQGYYTDKGRTGVADIALTYDAGDLIKGLKATTYFGFNVHDMVRTGKANDYIAYTSSISTKTGNDTIIKSNTHGLVTQSDQSRLMDYYFQRFSFYENISFDRTFGDNTLQSTLAFNYVKGFYNGIEEPQRNNNIVWTSMYSFRDKYSVQAVLNYAGSSWFREDLRFGLFPAIGANWVISDEGFMQNSKMFSYFKLRAQFGVIGNESNISPFYYRDRWNQNTSGSAFGPYSSLQWFGSTTDAQGFRNSPQRIGNPDLGWEKRKEFNAGFDALLFNKLRLDMSYYNWLVDGAVVQINNTLPYTAGLQGARPWYNYTQTRYNMITADLKFTGRSGSFSYTIGANAATTVSERVKYDEPNYRDDYQKRTGRPSDAMFGFEYIGKFATDAETLEVPQLFDAELKAGDLKYKDLNGDGFIDDNDQQMIGNSSPRLLYALNATLRYKNFEFYILGSGRAFYDVALTNTYFQSGWGDNNYSDFVKNNVDGDYPRLTYYRVNNNFVTSEYWLRKGDFFKIQNVEFSYTIPSRSLQFMGARAIKIYVRGANLMTFSQLKEVDPETMYTSGSNSHAAGVTTYPLFRTISGGVKFNF